ncbi:MAG: NADP-dependent oxidoreductase, partial [Candidatus Aminicenantales bacterium]
MAGIISREIRLKRRPLGLPGEEDFELAEVRVPDLEKGQMLVQNVFMSVDPYMRGRMDDRESYITPFALGEPLEGGCVGRIVASRQGRFREGDYVAGMKGWREFFITDGSDIVRVDPQAAPVQAYLGVLGMPGLTAYVGLLDIGAPRKGETVFVSAAAGAVGSVACQIAKIKGCRVVGSAGSDEKVAWLREHAGIDAAFNYKSVENLAEELARQCPEGVDVAFENVGGPFLEASIQAMSPHGRIVLCGMISVYNATRPTRAPRNLVLAIP